MTKEKTNWIYLILLSAVIFCGERFFYFFKMENTRDVDVCIFFVLLLLTISCNRIRNHKKFEFKYYIVILLVLTIITSFITHYAYGQTIINIINAIRYMAIYLLYFAVASNLKRQRDVRDTENILLIMGFVFSILAIIQFKYGESKEILPGMHLASRLDEIRFFAGFTVVIPSFFIALARNFQNQEIHKRILYIIINGIEFFYILNVTKTRSLLAALMIATVVLFFFQKKFKHVFKISIFILVGGIVFLLFGSSLSSIVELMLNDTTGTGDSRIGSIQFVLENIKKSPILGMGIYSANISVVPREVHVDIGIFGFYFEFGIIGLIWGTLFSFKIFRYICYLYKNNKERSYVYIGYFMCQLAMVTFACMFNYKEMIIYCVILLASLEYEVSAHKKGR